MYIYMHETQRAVLPCIKMQHGEDKDHSDRFQANPKNIPPESFRRLIFILLHPNTRVHAWYIRMRYNKYIHTCISYDTRKHIKQESYTRVKVYGMVYVHYVHIYPSWKSYTTSLKRNVRESAHWEPDDFKPTKDILARKIPMPNGHPPSQPALRN